MSTHATGRQVPRGRTMRSRRLATTLALLVGSSLARPLAAEVGYPSIDVTKDRLPDDQQQVFVDVALVGLAEVDDAVAATIHVAAWCRSVSSSGDIRDHDPCRGMPARFESTLRWGDKEVQPRPEPLVMQALGRRDAAKHYLYAFNAKFPVIEVARAAALDGGDSFSVSVALKPLDGRITTRPRVEGTFTGTGRGVYQHQGVSPDDACARRHGWRSAAEFKGTLGDRAFAEACSRGQAGAPLLSQVSLIKVAALVEKNAMERVKARVVLERRPSVDGPEALTLSFVERPVGFTPLSCPEKSATLSIAGRTGLVLAVARAVDTLSVRVAADLMFQAVDINTWALPSASVAVRSACTRDDFLDGVVAVPASAVVTIDLTASPLFAAALTQRIEAARNEAERVAAASKAEEARRRADEARLRSELGGDPQCRPGEECMPGVIPCFCQRMVTKAEREAATAARRAQNERFLAETAPGKLTGVAAHYADRYRRAEAEYCSMWEASLEYIRTMNACQEADTCSTPGVTRKLEALGRTERAVKARADSILNNAVRACVGAAGGVGNCDTLALAVERADVRCGMNSDNFPGFYDATKKK